MTDTVKKKITVNGRQMAYLEQGQGDPIVLLHGNPTSSYLWRNIVPHLAGLGRCIVPDLIGMGDSDKLEPSGPDRYTFAEHSAYLDGFLSALAIQRNVVLVIHDWGSALGFHWACRFPEAVQGIAYMEAIVCPLSWEQWPEAATAIFQGMRSAAGEDIVLVNNRFIEDILPSSILRKLTTEEMEEYRRPYLRGGEDRRPMLSWPRQIPLGGEPEDVVDIVTNYGHWLASSPVPKLFINADPGMILTGTPRDYCRSWPNQREVTVPGLHFVQEDSPHDIGAAVAEFIGTLR